MVCNFLCVLYHLSYKRGQRLLASNFCGTVPCSNDLLNSLQMEGTIIEAVSFKSLAGISSDPVALLVSNEVSKISTSNSDRLRSVKTGSYDLLEY